MQTLLNILLEEFGLSPVMAAELECYVLLPDELPETVNAFWQPVDAALRDVGVGLLRIEKERGVGQYEIVTQITTAPRLTQWLQAIRQLLQSQAREMSVEISFAARPFADEPSSGLHLHLHLADAEGMNVYHKTSEWTSDALRWSLGGLLASLPQAIEVFCPTAASYSRFDDADHVPKIAGWGVNNRYCALRIPMEHDPFHKRIEHRVPGADADPAASVAMMLEGVIYGLRNRIEPPPQTHGKPTQGLLNSIKNAP